MNTFLESDLVEPLLRLHLPRYHELPALDLYMDQVISVIEQVLQPLYPSTQQAIVTPTMINNYVKQKIVSPPVKKRYTRNHLAYFIVVVLLKPVFSMAEISALIRRQTQLAGTDVAYDRFCTELEESIRAILTCTALQNPLPPTGQADLVRATVMSLVNKVYVEKFLEFSARSESDPEKTPS